ncbi:TetR/AcrR family transcriptional regulator [Rhizobium sp. 2MFCol3.1]|uniref:TetR/AcrR family transcriptional regulator n=1 Tax=Rhizobium sp. 2MFCol3.1 TaxID=1246459 RepID=UPI000379A7E6|nr:TetR/AcrR family transcriptional regulator [Rhizobium sp. 2MFCol3.1]
MARPREFDTAQALDAAVQVFREHGFEGTSAAMLTKRMRIGRQSLYDTFGDKWKLYLSAVSRYSTLETSAHISTLNSKENAFEGIRAVVERVVAEARMPCLGVNSICEFGVRQTELSAQHALAAERLRVPFVKRIREAQLAGDLTSELEPDAVVDFLVTTFSGIRIAARGGADDGKLKALGEIALRALR